MPCAGYPGAEVGIASSRCGLISRVVERSFRFGYLLYLGMFLRSMSNMHSTRSLAVKRKFSGHHVVLNCL